MKRISLFPLILSVLFFLFVPLRSVQFLSILLICLYGFSFLISRYMFHSLDASREADRQYCPNRSRESLRFRLKNKGFLPLQNLIVSDSANGCYGEGIGIFFSDLSSRETGDFLCPVLTERRGKYRAGPIKVKGADPFNFFPWEKTFPLYTSIIVYPAGHPLKLFLSEGERGGVIKSGNPVYEDLSQLKGIRNYRPGDSLKRINWKASARTGKLKTMEFSRTLSAPLLVLLDLTISRYPLKHRHILLERAIEAAVSLIISYSESKQKVSLLVQGSDRQIHVPYGRGYGHVISVLEELAVLSCGGEDKGESVINAMMNLGIGTESGTHVSLLVPSLEGDLTGGMELLRKKRCNLQLVATGGSYLKEIPAYCRQFILSEYGKEYFS